MLGFEGIVNWYENFSVYKYDKKRILFEKPIYFGFCVLELSKLLKYEFYYYCLKSYWQDKIKLQYMDTASFVLCFIADHKKLVDPLNKI